MAVILKSIPVGPSEHSAINVCSADEEDLKEIKKEFSDLQTRTSYVDAWTALALVKKVGVFKL